MKYLLLPVLAILLAACPENVRPENLFCAVPEAPALETYSQACADASDCAIVAMPYCEQVCGSCGDAVVSIDERERFKEEHTLSNYSPPTDVACGACNCIVVSCVDDKCEMTEVDEDENTVCANIE